MTFEYYAWRVQLVVTLLFAAHLARLARRKGRHPFGAALLLLALANGWPLVFEAVGRGVAAGFALQEVPRTVLVRVFGYGGVMFGVALSYAIVGCWKVRPRSAEADVPQPGDRDDLLPK